MPLADTLGRPLRNLRLSVTDRCNLRCEYCMPEDDYAWLPREDVLHFEEISALVDVFITLGVDRLRLTGGEPLLRITVSLDTLHADRFRALARFDALDAVFAGIREAKRLFGGRPGGLKIDTVVIKGVNDDELSDLVEYGRALGAEVRFIEYMDV